MLKHLTATAATFLMLMSGAWAGNQQYEPLATSVSAALHRSVADSASPRLAFEDEAQGTAWLSEMSRRLEKFIADRRYREDLLVTVHYEATRAGLDPQLVLGLIEVESEFRKYAISSAGARGYMQVMPFWVKLIGDEQQHNLFGLRTNLRYGCVILRHYLDLERGNLYRALGRYNGTLGKSRYPNRVRRAWLSNWSFPAAEATVTRTAGENAKPASAPKVIF